MERLKQSGGRHRKIEGRHRKAEAGLLRKIFNKGTGMTQRAAGAVLNAAGKVAQVGLQIIFNANALVLKGIEKGQAPFEFGKFSGLVFCMSLPVSLPFSLTAMVTSEIAETIRRPLNTSKWK